MYIIKLFINFVINTMKFVILLILLISYNANAFNKVNGLHSYKAITNSINNKYTSYLPINIKSIKGSSELFGKSISGKALYASTSSSSEGKGQNWYAS